jgi:glutamyl-tRNA(Gln) amidotransferase subunit D
MAEPGDRIKIFTKDEEHEGILMPSLEESGQDTLILKLKNGYNIGIEKSKIKKTEVLEKHKDTKAKHAKVEKNDGLPTISILHTGGTIASKIDYRTGAVYSSFEPDELLNMFPELSKIANLRSNLIAKMWSDDLRFGHFELIAKAVKKEIEAGCDGIIIGMGTDNLAVASAAMSFILEELPIPVMFVGAQRSSDRGSSDAAMNLICAAQFITTTDFSGVAICMHESMDDENCVILPGCKTHKLHSSRRDAFKPVNQDIIARVNFNIKKIDFITKDYTKKDKDRKLIIKPKMEEKVGLLKVHVNMFPEQFEFYKGYKGLVIEGTGLGHTPGQVPNEICEIHKKIYPAIKKVIDSGCVVVMTTQTIYGRVHMHVYDKGTDLTALGVISGEDMLANTALVKLAWLLGNHKAEEVKGLISKNLRGEINERLTSEMYLY